MNIIYFVLCYIRIPLMCESVLSETSQQTRSRSFHTILPQRLNIGDRIVLTAEISGGITVDLYTKKHTHHDQHSEHAIDPDNIAAQMETDSNLKTITQRNVVNKTSRRVEVKDEIDYVNLIDGNNMHLELRVATETTLEVTGWGGSHVVAFSLDHALKDIYALHIHRGLRKIHKLRFHFA